MGYKAGLVSISFRKNTPLEIVKAMKAVGLKYIEWGSDVHAPFDNSDKLNEIIKLQKEYGVECCSYGTYFRLGVTPVSQLEDYIAAAKALGTDILRLWCGDKNSEDYSDDEKAKLFEACKSAAGIAQKHNVILCMECHNGTYTNTKESALELMNTINSKHFRMYWQPNQYRDSVVNIDYARSIAPFTYHIHVFNWCGNERCPLSLAEYAWKQYLSQFTGDRYLLLEFMPDDKIETLPVEVESLKKIIGELE